MKEKMRAAVVAAIQAYLEEEQAARAAQASRGSRWLRQGRLEAMGRAQACFDRRRTWR